MGKIKIIPAGSKFGRLEVLEMPRKVGHRTFYLCKCLCGSVGDYRRDSLVGGVTTSCGCFQKENMSEIKTVHGFYKNKANSSMLTLWRGMFTRCYDSSNKSYLNYGGRGIKVCDRWNGFPAGLDAFIADMGERPTDEHSIDRIDVNGNYEPDNCRWALPLEQSRNRRNSVCLEIGGVTKTIAEWSDIFEIRYQTALSRYHKKYPIEFIFYQGKLGTHFKPNAYSD